MIDKNIILSARKASLYEFFKKKGYTLKKSGNKGHYRVKGYQGLVIKDNMFYQFSTGKKGNSIDCLTEVFGYSFKEAVSELCDISVSHFNHLVSEPIKTKFELPGKAKNMRRIFAYLIKTRGIKYEIVQNLVNNNLLYQDHKGNCVFIWLNEKNKPVGAELHGTLTDIRFKQVWSNSNYNYSFHFSTGFKPTKVYFFESAIDLLSYISLYNPTEAIFLSMAGLNINSLDFAIKNNFKGFYGPLNGLKYYLCVDNIYMTDKNNKSPTLEFYNHIKYEYGCKLNYPPFYFKDWNDYLINKKEMAK